ncbi:MAG: efflux RND transporter periplasmic adaptor subunit [Acidobacteriota bacterium]|nr:efflux RND transporter periplasmic adaptor subunit [Acidobacteriota bacterium]
MKNKTLVGILAALLAVGWLGLSGCAKKDGTEAKASGVAKGARMSFPVEVEKVGVRSLIFSVSAVGAVEAFEKVQVTARVAGIVDRVLFAEGSYVNPGDPLVEIEPERYNLTVESAQATYDRAVASKADAEAGLKRREAVSVQNPGLIPGEELETWRTKVRLAAADVAQTQAALNQAKLNLRDAYVRAPFGGAVQTRTVQTGQYVQVGTVLASLVRRDPLLLRFRVPERDAAQLRNGIVASFQVRDNPKIYTAVLTNIAASADESSRMVEVTGHVRDSADSTLRPGSFVEITIPVSKPREAPVIRQTAIRPSERGFIAFVVEDGVAKERILTIGMRTIDGQAEVLSGLAIGESLVVRGTESLQNGFPVRVMPPGGMPGTEGEKPAGDKPPAGR